MIAIINYGSGNIAAISNIYQQLKIPHIVTCQKSEIENSTHIILPGVGAFDTTMQSLHKSGLTSVIKEQVLGSGKKILGICVGMQILANSSDEGELEGLGLIDGHITKISESRFDSGPKLPHMGWNSINISGAAQLFHGVDVEKGFYFLHSYYFNEESSADSAAIVDYGGEFTCAVARENVFGVQFHPEKSHSNGIKLLRNFSGT